MAVLPEVPFFFQLKVTVLEMSSLILSRKLPVCHPLLHVWYSRAVMVLVLCTLRPYSWLAVWYIDRCCQPVKKKKILETEQCWYNLVITFFYSQQLSLHSLRFPWSQHKCSRIFISCLAPYLIVQNCQVQQWQKFCFVGILIAFQSLLLS